MYANAMWAGEIASMTSETKLRLHVGGRLACLRRRHAGPTAFTFLLAALSALIQNCAPRHDAIYNGY